MESYFATGHAADAILAALALEAAWLHWRGWGAVELAAMLLPAALIVLGLRGALTGSAWPWIAAPLALSFPAHLADLSIRRAQTWTRNARARVRRRRRPSAPPSVQEF